ncbi:hypothetical protein [Acidocella facilis]|uniref:hypothetical protein n=1 Tax=Acidocella facilis TaxID=525 RepID=UPI001F1AA86A|nr:hypothetical protein [Acidocella facilis]
MHVQDDLNADIHDRLKLRAKKNGIKKPVQEIFSGDDQRKSKGDWVDKHRLIDRENDRYIETVRDKKTGEIIHHSDEPLTEHWGHGSAKGKQPPDNGDKTPSE